MKFIFGLLMVVLLLPLPLCAQDWKALDTDDLFERAKQQAFNGQRTEAREVLHFILAKSPEYEDARILLGRTYAWDEQYESARQEFKKVLEKSDYLDAYQAYVDVEMWSKSFQNGLTIVELGLKNYPNDEELLFKKAKILNDLDRQEESILVLNNLLLINPSHDKGISLLNDIKLSRMRFTVGVTYGIDLFRKTFDPAHFSSFQLGRTNRWGSLIGRINYAYRFGTNGVQPELDAYPRIANGVYAYINYGFSNTDLFPKHRIGAELYTKLPRSFEASAGMRYFFFNYDTKITIYTGSLGWYVGNYWLSLRPFITPDNQRGTSVSGTFTLRRYFSEAETYVGISGGLGFSPDIRRLQNSAGLSSDEIYLLHAQRAGIALQKLLKSNFIINGSIDVSRQELIFDEGNFVSITSLTIGLKKKF